MRRKRYIEVKTPAANKRRIAKQKALRAMVQAKQTRALSKLGWTLNNPTVVKQFNNYPKINGPALQAYFNAEGTFTMAAANRVRAGTFHNVGSDIVSNVIGLASAFTRPIVSSSKYNIHWYSTKPFMLGFYYSVAKSTGLTEVDSNSTELIAVLEATFPADLLSYTFLSWHTAKFVPETNRYEILETIDFTDPTRKIIADYYRKDRDEEVYSLQTELGVLITGQALQEIKYVNSLQRQVSMQSKI